MLKHGIDRVVRGGIRKQMDFSAAWWRYAMHGDTSLPDAIARRDTARFTWLKNAVLPALEKEIVEQRRHGSEAAYELFEAFIARMKP